MMPCPRWIQKYPFFCISIKIWENGGPKCVGSSYFFVRYFLQSILFQKLVFSCTLFSKNENDWSMLYYSLHYIYIKFYNIKNNDIAIWFLFSGVNCLHSCSAGSAIIWHRFKTSKQIWKINIRLFGLVKIEFPS